MQKTLKAVAAAAMLAASGYASAINIGGLTIPTTGDGFTFKVGSVFENLVTGAGQELQGFGEVHSILGQNISDLCAGCELTYRFDGYIVNNISAPDAAGNQEITFTGGRIQLYLDFSPDFNPYSTNNSYASALAAATDGTLFLDLLGTPVRAGGVTFVGQGTNLGGSHPVGAGFGLASVDAAGGGIANAFFDTNRYVGFGGASADADIRSSFGRTALPAWADAACQQGDLRLCVAGSVDMTAAPIPEPETYALMLAGIGVVGWIAKRRRRSN